MSEDGKRGPRMFPNVQEAEKIEMKLTPLMRAAGSASGGQEPVHPLRSLGSERGMRRVKHHTRTCALHGR